MLLWDGINQSITAYGKRERVFSGGIEKWLEGNSGVRKGQLISIRNVCSQPVNRLLLMCFEAQKGFPQGAITIFEATNLIPAKEIHFEHSLTNCRVHPLIREPASLEPRMEGVA